MGLLNYNALGGFSRNGGILRYGWGNASAFLSSVDVAMEWDDVPGGQDLLYLEVQIDDNPRNRTYVEGSSPIRLHVDIPRGHPLGEDLVVTYGTASNATPVGSAAVVDQTVYVTAQFGYSC